MTNILFVIFSHGGVGGHFYSFVTTVSVLKQRYNITSVVLGTKDSPVLNDAGLEHTYIKANYRNQWQVARKLNKIIKEKQIELIHTFDSLSYLSCIYSSVKFRIPICRTKCGGSPTKYLPYCNNMVLFTLEDLNFIQERRKGLNLKLIPNRTTPFKLNDVRMSSLIEDYELQNKRVIFRIGRIGKAYLKTALQGISLTKELHKKDERFTFVLIGYVNDDESLNAIKEAATGCDYIKVITDIKYTLDAKELLGIADIVIGTGRGFMEGCSFNKIMFAPCKNHSLPVMVTEDNFNDIFSCNFSERYVDNKPEVAIDTLLEIINAKNSNSKEWFNTYFSTERLEEMYSEFYKNLKPTNFHKLFLQNLWSMVKMYLKGGKK